MVAKKLLETSDLTDATAELLPDDPVIAIPEPVMAESALIVEMKARIENLVAVVARLEADNAQLNAPPAENYQRVKAAIYYSGVPRTTLMRAVEANKVKFRRDRNGKLEIDVNDAIRLRGQLTEWSGKNGQ